MLLQRHPALARQPDDQACRKCILEIPACQRIAALGARASCPADQAAQGAVAGAVGRQDHELQIIRAAQLRPDDQRQPVLLGCDMRTHHPGQRAFIGER